MNAKNRTIVISDPAGYLKKTRPGHGIKKTRSVCINEALVPSYIIEERNSCTVNAAACLLVFASGKRHSFGSALELCRSIALRGYSRIRHGATDYYTRIGREAPYIRRCLKAASAGYSANSSLFVKRLAIKEILSGRPVLLNIAFSGQYRDHTVTAYGFEEYAAGPRGRKVMFFKVRDGYSKEPRYLEYKGIFGISITYLKERA